MFDDIVSAAIGGVSFQASEPQGLGAPDLRRRPPMSDAMLERCIEAIPAVMAGLRGNDTTQIETMRCVWCGLPLVDSKCNTCFPPSKPSREAILRQAILNVAQRKSWTGDAHSYLRAYITAAKDVPSVVSYIRPEIVAEFAKLTGAA